jgi:hypothetical protein
VKMHGTPVYKPAPSKKRVFVTIEGPDWTYIGVRMWTGRSVAGIRRAAKEAYPGHHLQFGRWF